ncbi:MAG: TenA family protein [Dehalococcoidia bacterium]
MKRSDAFRERHAADWERMVRHPFVLALGRGDLPKDAFGAYMVQDYLFIEALVRTVAYGVAKAPSVQAAKPLGDFLAVLLGAEDDLFRDVFASLGREWPMREKSEPLPVIRRFGAFLEGVGKRGSFAAIATALYVTEGTYADWAQGLVREGLVPDDSLYKGWIDIHAVPSLADFAAYVGGHMGAMEGSPEDEALERIFQRALRYEIGFWDAVYPRRGVPGDRRR